MSSTKKLSDTERKARRKASYTKWYENNREYHRWWHIEKKYGLTKHAFEAMLEGQGSSCAICRSSEPLSKNGWDIDHDHASGDVRGILCHPCNVMLGAARDNPAFLNAGAEYLREQHG